MFPFDHIVLVENAEPSSLYKFQISEFQAHVEVRSARPNDWDLRDVMIQRTADGEWVREPHFHDLIWRAACSSTATKAIEAAVESEIADRRANEMYIDQIRRSGWFPSDAGDVRREMEVA